MAFFDIPLQPPAPSELQPQLSQPPWFGPPQGVIPGYSPQRAVIFRTESAILMAGQFVVYPAGVEFTLSLSLAPQAEEWFDCPWELHHHPRRGHSIPPPEDLLRFGILYPDGSKWTNLLRSFPAPEEEPVGPVVMHRGGGGGGNSWKMAYWLWPLPPDGPLTFVAQWPALGVEESSASIDGSALRQAATEAEVVWST